MISIPDLLLNRVETASVAAYPNEACGVLVGLFGDQPNERLVHDILPIVNAREADEQYHRFRIEPADYLAAEKWASEKGLDIVGFYHSHPDHPAVPSDYDRDHAFPGLSYIVVAVEGTDKQHPKAIRTTSWALALDRTAFHLEAELDSTTSDADPHRGTDEPAVPVPFVTRGEPDNDHGRETTTPSNPSN